MRVTTLLRQLIGVTQMYVDGVRFSEGALEVAVRPSWRLPRCGKCCRRAPRYDRRPSRQWLHPGIGSTRVNLVYAPWRVKCRECGVRVEEVSWAASGSRFTAALEELGAYLAQGMDQTRVSKILGLSWEAVGNIVHRLVERRLDPKRLDGLTWIGIDEFSYRKRHHYLTVIVDHRTRRVIWAGKGRSAESLSEFFELLGSKRRSEISLVTIDMAGGYIKAVQENLPNAEIVFDRFHVERLAADAVDEVRRELVRGLGPEEAKGIKGLRWVLLKHPDRHTPAEDQKISELRRWNAKLFRAWGLKEALAEILEHANRKEAGKMLEQWLGWATRSRLSAFVKLARTIRKHRDGVLRYIETLMTNGIVEGFNNKLRVIARRAYGFHSPEALTAMLFLCCGGIQLHPQLPTRT